MFGNKISVTAAILSWGFLIFLVLLFITPIDQLFLYNVAKGYEGAIGRLLILLIFGFIISLISTLYPFVFLGSKEWVSLRIFALYCGPMIGLIAFAFIFFLNFS